MDIFNNNCFNVFPKLENNSIDFVLVDLPYGSTKCKWDCLIDLTKMWIELKRICKKKCIYVFFCTTKFGVSLINSKPKWFKYDLVWEKSKKVGFLSANRMPLRKHEMIYVFGDNTGGKKNYNPQKVEGKPYFKKHQSRNDNNELYEITRQEGNNKTGLRHPHSILQFEEPTHEMVYIFGDNDTNDLENERNKDLREYAKMIHKKIGKTKKQIYKDMGNQKLDHFFRYKSSQFKLPIKEVYDKMIEFYKLDIKEFEELEFNKEEQHTYNPQKTEGKPYKKNENIINGIYGNVVNTKLINKGDRYPTTILKFNNPNKPVHRTQKPVDLCEWLIKSYTNEGDLVLDFTMGSGTTGIACKNTNRKFIGIEMDKEIFEIAKKRLND